MKQAMIGLLVVVVVGGVIYFVNSKNSDSNVTSPTEMMKNKQSSATSESSETSSTSTPPGVPPETTNADVKVIDVEAGSFYYKPNIIEVTKGQKIKIVLSAVSMMHDFNVDELGVKMPIVKNGNKGTVEFTADKVGTFEYYCSVGQHRANGQVGKITVK